MDSSGSSGGGGTAQQQQQQHDGESDTRNRGGGGGGGSSNLNTKYQKLAAEYAKLRSQVQVLKKAVVEEQQKHESLRTTVTTQSIENRKLEQELDSVKFRNRQLEKRIQVLQEDSASASLSKHSSLPGSHPSSSSSSSTSASAVAASSSIDSNLLLHMEQNKQLQESLATLNERYTTEVGRLRRVIDHEMVPRDLFDSMKSEHLERHQAVTKCVQELKTENTQLRDRLDAFLSSSTHTSGSSSKNNAVTEETAAGLASGSTAAMIDPGSASTTDLVRRLTESEQAREKLNSEVQILRLKVKRYHGTQQQGSSSEDTSASAIQSPVVEERTNMIGRLEVVGMEIGDVSIGGGITTSSVAMVADDRDVLVAHLRDRVDELVKALQLSDSKAIHYYHEALSLCRLLKTSQLSYKRLDGEFAKLKSKYRQLQEETEDVKRNYNAQLDSLTEHVAILNDKLSLQAEEILVLKNK